MPTTDTLTIEIDGSIARLTALRTDLLRGWLTCDERVCQVGGPRGHQFRHRPYRLYTIDEEYRLVTFAGLVPRLKGALEAASWHVEITDVTTRAAPLLLDRQLLASAQDEDKDYLEALTGSLRGQVLYHAGWQLGQLLLLARRAYPQARTLIVTPNRPQALSLAQRLGPRLPNQLSAAAGQGFHPGCRVLINTMQQFRPAMDDPDTFRLVLLVDADRIVRAAVSAEALGRMGQRRIYGFVRSDQRLSQRERLEVEAVCGPVVYEVPGVYGRTARVQVVLAEPPWTPLPFTTTALAFKRKTLWHNRQRNEAVAGLALALAAGRDEDLRRQGILHPNGRLPAPNLGGRRVVVLVETTEHGLALTALLPDWPLFTASTASTGERLPDAGLPQHSMITQVVASRLSHIPADVLIWAGGGQGSLELRGFPPIAIAGRQKVVVIDFADDGNEAAEADTRSRLRNYLRRGWEISGPDRWLSPGGAGEPVRRPRQRSRRTQ